jgi:nucleoid DNA-binding protein
MRLAEIGNDKLRFPPDVMRPILEENRADIDWMEARLGQSLHEELGEYRPGDVRNEADLLNPHPEVVSKLIALLGARAPVGVTGETPEQVVLLMHALRGPDAPGFKVEKDEGKPAAQVDKQAQIILYGGASMKGTELIAQIQQSDPQLLNGIPAHRAEALVKAVFMRMNEVLAKKEEGAVNFSGLGRFRIKKVERTTGGERIARTQIIFRRDEPGLGRNSPGVESEG